MYQSDRLLILLDLAVPTYSLQFFEIEEKTQSISLILGTLKTLIGLVAPGKSVKEICDKGDQLLLDETSKVRLLLLLFLSSLFLFCLFGFVSTIQ